MRSFIAIDLSRDIKSRITDMQSKLRVHASSGRWKYVDNFHLTLKFLDDIDLRQLSKICCELKNICSQTDKFKLILSNLGNFPGNGCVRVLWLGINGELDRLYSLQKEIDNRMDIMGFQKEKRAYKPHITIGQDIVFNEKLDNLRNFVSIDDFPEIIVDRIYLFKSEQVGRKRVYTPIEEFRFGELI